jgi:glycosyltransferase involved in cell wall biosynthesis
VVVGLIRKEKNQALAVEAFARARCRGAARLRLVGDGPERAAVAALAAARGVADRVDFVGMVDDTAPEYRAGDVFLNSSSTEQMPLSLLEGMASGLPVVATDVGDVRAMVDECNRDWIVPANDADRLARAMDAAFDDPDARTQRGAANRAPRRARVRPRALLRPLLRALPRRGPSRVHVIAAHQRWKIGRYCFSI